MKTLTTSREDGLPSTVPVCKHAGHEGSGESSEFEHGGCTTEMRMHGAFILYRRE